MYDDPLGGRDWKRGLGLLRPVGQLVAYGFANLSAGERRSVRRLVGQLTAFLPSHFLEVPRNGPDGRFQPVKDPEELDARRANIEEILRARGVI